MTNTPDKISELFGLLPSGAFKDEDELRGFVQDDTTLKDVYSFLPQGYFTDEAEYMSYFGDTLKKKESSRQMPSGLQELGAPLAESSPATSKLESEAKEREVAPLPVSRKPEAEPEQTDLERVRELRERQAEISKSRRGVTGIGGLAETTSMSEKKELDAINKEILDLETKKRKELTDFAKKFDGLSEKHQAQINEVIESTRELPLLAKERRLEAAVNQMEVEYDALTAERNRLLMEVAEDFTNLRTHAKAVFASTYFEFHKGVANYVQMMNAPLVNEESMRADFYEKYPDVVDEGTGEVKKVIDRGGQTWWWDFSEIEDPVEREAASAEWNEITRHRSKVKHSVASEYKKWAESKQKDEWTEYAAPLQEALGDFNYAQMLDKNWWANMGGSLVASTAFFAPLAALASMTGGAAAGAMGLKGLSAAAFTGLSGAAISSPVMAASYASQTWQSVIDAGGTNEEAVAAARKTYDQIFKVSFGLNTLTLGTAYGGSHITRGITGIGARRAMDVGGKAWAMVFSGMDNYQQEHTAWKYAEIALGRDPVSILEYWDMPIAKQHAIAGTLMALPHIALGSAKDAATIGGVSGHKDGHMMLLRGRLNTALGQGFDTGIVEAQAIAQANVERGTITQAEADVFLQDIQTLQADANFQVLEGEAAIAYALNSSEKNRQQKLQSPLAEKKVKELQTQGEELVYHHVLNEGRVSIVRTEEGLVAVVDGVVVPVEGLNKDQKAYYDVVVKNTAEMTQELAKSPAPMYRGIIEGQEVSFRDSQSFLDAVSEVAKQPDKQSFFVVHNDDATMKRAEQVMEEAGVVVEGQVEAAQEAAPTVATDALKDVESTTKALEEVQSGFKEKGFIAEQYHDAKKKRASERTEYDNRIIERVESLLQPTPEQTTTPQAAAESLGIEFIGEQKNEAGEATHNTFNVEVDGQSFTFMAPIEATQAQIKAERDKTVQAQKEAPSDIEATIREAREQGKLPPEGQETATTAPVQHGKVAIPAETARTETISKQGEGITQDILFDGEKAGTVSTVSDAGVTTILNVEVKKPGSKQGRNIFYTLRDQARAQGSEFVSQDLTSDMATEKAMNVWNSLLKRGEVERVGNRFVWSDIQNKEALVEKTNNVAALRKASEVQALNITSEQYTAIESDLASMTRAEFKAKYPGLAPTTKAYNNLMRAERFASFLNGIGLNSEQLLEFVEKIATFAKENKLTEKYGNFKDNVGQLAEEVARRKGVEEKAAGTEVQGDGRSRGRGRTGDQKAAPTKVERTQARVAETRQALSDAFNKWKDQGIAYDPRSKAAADVDLTKALINHLVAVGANTVAKIQAAIKDAIGLEMSKKDAQFLLEATQRKEASQEGQSTTKGEKVPESEAKVGKKRSGFEERSVRERGEKDDVGKVVRDIVEADPTFYNVMNREEAKADAVAFIEEAGGFDAAYAKVVTPSRQLFNAKGENVAAQRQVIRQVLLQYYGEQLAESIRSNDKEAMLAAEEKITPLTDILAKEATAGGQMSSMLFWKRLPGEATVHMIDKAISEGNTKKLGFEAQEAQQVADAIRKEMQQEVNKLTNENEGLKKEIERLIAKYKYGEGRSGTTKVPQAKAKEIANKIRSLKTSNLGITFADPTGIVAIMDGALEVTARVVETTGNILQAINEGLAIIRNSKAFKELSKNKQAEVVNKYKESLREETGFEASQETLKTDGDFRNAVFDVIRNHYLSPVMHKRGLVTSLMEDIGLTKKEAEAISKVAFEHFREHANKTFEKVLNPKDSENRKKVLKAKSNKFIELINDGVLFNDNFSQLFAEKFGLPAGLTMDQRAEIHKLATNATNLAPYGIFGDLATKQLADYVRNIMPKEGWGKRVTETIIGLRYASMLSGPTTHFVNLFSSMINPPLHAIGRAVDAGAWIRALAYLYRGDRKGFAANNPLVDLVYSPLVARKQIGVAWNKLRNTIKDGDVREASKWVEGYRGRGQLESLIKTPILERITFGGQWSSVKYKGQLINIHPGNLAKYVGRFLLAEDQFLYSLSFDVESAIFIRLRLIEESGLTGRALRDAVIREIQGDFLDASKTQRVEQRLQDAVNKARDAGIEVTSTRLQSLRTDFIRQENGMNPEQSAAAEQAARRTNFTEQRGGIFSAIADGLNRFSNYNIWTKLVSMPFFPFTTILGRLGDMALDTMYGGVRAHGFSPTGIIARYRQQRETGNKSDFWVHPSDMGMYKSAALGSVGSRRYEQQMAAQYFGLTLFAFAAPTFMRINEDDPQEMQFFDVTGGLNYDSNEKKAQHPLGPHTLKIGPIRLRYSSKPILSGIFSLLGNYKDALRAGVNLRDEELLDKVKLSMLSMSSSWTTITETTAASGAKDFITLVSTVMGEVIGEDAFEVKKIEEDGIDWSFSPKISRELIKLGKNYADVAGSVSPLKANFIQQIWRGVSPAGRLRGTPGQVFMYNIGLQNLTNDLRTDIFGQPVETMPGDANIAWPRESDWRWKVMWDGNVDITDVRPWVEVKIRGEWRTMEYDEFLERKKIANNLFKEKFDGYLKDIAKEGEDYKDSAELKKRSQLTETREVRSKKYKESKLHQDLQGVWSDVDANVMKYMFLWDEFIPTHPQETEWLRDNLHMPTWKGKIFLEPYEEQMSLRVEQAFNNARMTMFLKAIAPMVKNGELDKLLKVIIDPRTRQTAADDLLSEIWKDMEGYGMEAAYREYRLEQEEMNVKNKSSR